jgi:protein-tyrosine phosphatase
VDPIVAPPLVYTPLNNWRDLGGMPVTGGVVRPGVVWRSDDPSTVPDADAEDLVRRGLTDIIDLRSPREADRTGRGPLAASDVIYHRISLLRGKEEPGSLRRHIEAGTGTPDVVGQGYAGRVIGDAETLVRAYTIIADSTGATLVHCAAGKDRTGLFIGTLLAFLGASDEDIIADYALSEVEISAIMHRVTSAIGYLLDAEHHFRAAIHSTGPVEPLIGAHPDSMRAMLDHLREAGGIRKILVDAGMTPELEARLRARVVEVQS